MGKKTTQKNFIEVAKIVHGDKYDYSQVFYKNSKEKINIICKNGHGVFTQKPSAHQKGFGCPKCGAIKAGDTRKKTLNQFLSEANKIHNNVYDYSLTKYVDSITKVKVVCKEHGMFEITPNSHTIGKSDCQKCGYISVGKKNSFDVNIFIAKAKERHGDMYDYSLVDYKNSKENIELVCKEHGIFKLNPNSHLRGTGCRKCGYKSHAIKNSKTKEYFIDRSNKIHNNKYDYSLVKFIDLYSNVNIVCPIHGEFQKSFKNHIHKKRGCPKCFDSNKIELSKEHFKNNFINMANKIHSNKYEYTSVEYKNNITKVKIKCKFHNEFFQQTPSRHLFENSGCPKCVYNNKKIKHTKTLEQFVIDANIVHNNKYGYSLVDYKNAKNKIDVICPIHGVFKVVAGCHSSGKCGCPKCYISSKGEEYIKYFLEEKNINFIPQMKFEDCKNKRRLPFDFYLKEYNIIIEYDGKQHYEIREFFGGEVAFKERQNNDRIKNQYCLDNNIPLHRIRYDEDLKVRLKEIMKTLN